MTIKIDSLTPQIRYLDDMRDLLYDQQWAQDAPNLELYYMYRDLAENQEDLDKIKENQLRYDITLMNPLLLGREFNKTAGHTHPLVPETELSYPELYQVLKGKVIFLLQKTDKNKVQELYAIKAWKNDKVIVPPNFEHIMINFSKKKSKTANWVCRDFKSNIYQPIRKRHGFCYFALKDKDSIEWVKNKEYRNIPKLRFIKSNQWMQQFNLDQNESIYELAASPNKLQFLKTPQDYKWE